MKKYGTMLMTLCVAWVAAAQDESSRDTSTTYRLPEVVVTATRTPISAKDSPSPVEIVGREDIQNAGGTNVADVLKNAGGVFLKDQGGDAALKTISLRGSSSEQVLVLVNGVRLNSFQNGLVDFSLLPLNDIDRIEIVRGGSSAFYGADALGGVVNILKRKASSGVRFHGEVGAGSFGYQRYLAEGQGRLSDGGFLVGYGNERGRDDFPFVWHRQSGGDTVMNRINADFRKRQTYLNGDLSVDDRSSLEFTSAYVRSERGAPGSLTFLTSLARQNDDDINLGAGYRSVIGDNVELFLGTAFHYSFETYNDPDPFFPIDSYYKNTMLDVNPQARFSFNPNHRLTVGGEFGQGSLDGNDFDSKITRVQKSLYASDELRLEAERPWVDRVSLYGTLRYDDISDVDKAWTPKIGLNIRLLREGDLRLRASYGSNFRAPSFNDMYYRGFSNASLKPERSKSFDAGILAEAIWGGVHSFEVSYFNLDTENKIVLDPATYLPFNIGRARSEGLETIYEGRFLDGFIGLKANYTYTDARKRNRSSEADSTFDRQLLFIPKYVANVSLCVRLRPVTLNVRYNAVGTRYTSEDNSSWLSPYGIVSCNATVHALAVPGLDLYAKIEVQNLFDRDYQVFPNYPMPQRDFRVTIGADY